MAEVKVPTEAQNLVAPFGVHPPMEEVHLQKTFEAEQTEAGAFLTGDQQAKKHMNQVAQISKHLEKWQTITKDPFILDIVKNGYTIEFTDFPRQETVIDSQDFPKMQTVTEELILKQARNSEIKNSRLLQQALSCRQKRRRVTTSSRPKQIKQFCCKRKDQMEVLFVVKSLLKKGYYMAKLDRTEAFVLEHSSISKVTTIPPISMKKQNLLVSCFAVRSLKCPPHIFTKMMKPIIAALHEQGLPLITFLDDILLIGENFTAVNENIQITIDLLTSLQVCESTCQNQF